MDKETLSNYGWVVVCVLVLACMLALATPFGNFIADGFKATYVSFWQGSKEAMNTGLSGLGVSVQDPDADGGTDAGGDTGTPPEAVLPQPTQSQHGFYTHTIYSGNLSRNARLGGTGTAVLMFVEDDEGNPCVITFMPEGDTWMPDSIETLDIEDGVWFDSLGNQYTFSADGQTISYVDGFIPLYGSLTIDEEKNALKVQFDTSYVDTLQTVTYIPHTDNTVTIVDAYGKETVKSFAWVSKFVMEIEGYGRVSLALNDSLAKTI